MDDYSKVGAVLGALLTKTIFWKRASIFNNIAGGAALGIGGGVLTHVVQMFQAGGTKAVEAEVKSLPDPAEIGKGIKDGK